MSNLKRSHPAGTEGTDKKRSHNEQQQEGSIAPKTKDSFPSVVELNVGGKLITTLLSTLTKEPGSRLAAMFTRKEEIEKDEHGHFFLDLDAKVFQHVLNFLRLETLPPTEMALSVYDLANNLIIGELASKLENYQTVKYRQRIERLRYSDMRQYEQFREEVIKKIISSNPSRPEKTLLLIGADCHCPELDLKKKEDLPAPLKLPPIYDANMVNRYKAALNYDLCEMGYAKYIKSKTITSEICNKCENKYTRHEIVLISH